MNCKQARVLMSAAVDGELSFTEEQMFRQHLSKCRKCTEEFDDAKKTKLIIKERILRFKAPQTLIDSIMQLTVPAQERQCRSRTMLSTEK